MKQYLELMTYIIENGVDIVNKRTGKVCRTVINYDLEFDVGAGEFPLVTTRKSFYKGAIAELVGYVKGLTNSEDFAKLGANTWSANANKNTEWLSNPNRKGTNDMGKVYGAIAKDFGGLDLFHKVYNNLRNGIDDRGEIVTFWKPDEFHKGCLRPCVHSHHFSILGDTLYLNSTQRSCDVPLGLNWNMVQCYTLLALMAQITGLKPGKAYLKIVNAHIYSDQIEGCLEQIQRIPYGSPTLNISEDIKTLEDIENLENMDGFSVFGYSFHPPIKFPFTE